MKDLKGLNLGFAMCGSFCTFSKALVLMQGLVDLGINVFPIMSYNAYETSTRFGKSTDIHLKIEAITNKTIIHTLVDAEPLGPKSLIDALVIAPCTGNTLAKLSNGITDSPVLLAANATLISIPPFLKKLVLYSPIPLCLNFSIGALSSSLIGFFKKIPINKKIIM